MTDLEMDLVLAQARIKQLEKELAEATSGKCSFGPGVTIKPDGINELDPCDYELIEKHGNVTVEILRCKKCGHIEILWHRQEDTIDEGGMDDE